ncbi:MAG: GNAT family N-acetyltransferase [Chloroflexi bacterium]|nr:GNAT family N-acetyltransferase [Chloroflexota bacterium]
MTLSNDLPMRDATPDDVPAIGALRESVGWGVNEWALRIVIGQPFARCLVVESEDGIAGVGSGVVYGSLGFIGNMIVADAHRRRGIGSAILAAVTAYLEAAGCRRLELNATSEGRPLYERHGFASIGRSATTQLRRDLPLRRDPSVTLRSADGVGEIAAYDRPRFGGDRHGLLALLHDDPATVLVTADRSGEMVGYACLRTDAPRIGPLLADEPSVAEMLLAEAFDRLPDVSELRVNLPPNNRPGSAWLRRLGVPIEPWDGRMARGEDVAKREETLYGMTVGALG